MLRASPLASDDARRSDSFIDVEKGKERAVPAGTEEFNVVNEVRALTLPTNIKLIIKAGVKVRRDSD